MFTLFAVGPLILAGAGAAGETIAETTGGGAALGGPVGAAAGLLVGLAIVGVGAWIVYNQKADETPKTDDKPTKDCPDKAKDKPYKVSDKRRKHILDGDETGGGHGPGRGTPGKSEFPGSLTDDEIVQGVEGIANDPANYPDGKIPTDIPPGKGVAVDGTIKGVPTTVIVRPTGEGIVTAWPKGVPRNP